MSICFVTGQWVDGETGALSDKGGELVKAIQIEYPGLTVKALGWDTEAELEVSPLRCYSESRSDTFPGCRCHRNSAVKGSHAR